MNHIVVVLVFLASLLPASADELRIARFDAQRVFEQYQHTKDIQKDVDMKRSVRRPDSANRDNVPRRCEPERQ